MITLTLCDGGGKNTTPSATHRPRTEHALFILKMLTDKRQKMCGHNRLWIAESVRESISRRNRIRPLPYGKYATTVLDVLIDNILDLCKRACVTSPRQRPCPRSSGGFTFFRAHRRARASALSPSRRKRFLLSPLPHHRTRPTPLAGNPTDR